MKKVALAAAISLAATSAMAGGIAEPVMEPEVVVEDTSTSSDGGILVPLLAVVLIGAAVVAANN